MQMHESMIPKADKKSSKEGPTLDRKNLSRGQIEKIIKSLAPFSPTQHESLAVKIKRHVS